MPIDFPEEVVLSPGPRNLVTDVGGLLVGNADDPALRSGTTVLTAARPFAASVHVAGGAPGTREGALLAPEEMVAEIDALVLSGGSAFGLGAAEGVMAALREAGRGHAVGPVRVPIVPAAILFDLLNGGNKTWDTSPYPELGRRAFLNANDDFSLGSAGAGYGALTADLKGGLGSASCRLVHGDKLLFTVGALVAVNAVGSVVVDGGPHFWAAPFEMDGEFGGLGPSSAHDPRPLRLPRLPEGADPAQIPRSDGMPGRTNTTIAIVATDAALDKAALKRLAIAAHDGIARAVVPAHTPLDGDLVFAVSTGSRPLTNPALDLYMLGHAAAVTLARAIARGIHAATPMGRDLRPAWQSLFG